MKPKFVWMIALVLGVALPGVSFANGPKESGKPVALKTDKDADKKTEAEKKAEHVKKVAESHELAVKWVMAMIAKVAPPGRKMWVGKEGQETKAEGLKRHRSIANDLIEVVFNPNTNTVFKGKTGRARTATLMMGIMLHESGFGKHIDHNLGPFARGDNGNSWCMMQLNVGRGRTWKHAGGWNVKHDRPWKYGDKKEDIVDGASGPEMIKDRRKCFTAGLRLIKVSFRACRHNVFKRRLNVYASGSCKKGGNGSRRRINSGIKMYTGAKKLQVFEDKHLVEYVGNMLKKRAADEKKAKALAAKKKAKDDAKKAEKKPSKDKAPAKKPDSKKKAVRKTTTKGRVASNL